VVRDQSPTQSTEENDRSEEKAYDQENLPESSQVETLETLISKPLPPLLDPPLNPRIFAQHTAKYNNCERYE
jgi:hypothetical protein